MASTISSSGSLSQSSDDGVGLSNPQLAQGRRTMLDLVNRLHSTGSVYLIVLVFIQLIFLARCSMQCASRYRSSSDCCYWFTECWKVLTHWIHIRNHSASCSWDLYTVLNLFFFASNFLASNQPTSSCPTECRLSYSEYPWQCIVSLRFITDELLGQARNEVFGSVIYDKSEVEERIRRAQRAILNPKKIA